MATWIILEDMIYKGPYLHSLIDFNTVNINCPDLYGWISSGILNFLGLWVQVALPQCQIAKCYVQSSKWWGVISCTVVLAPHCHLPSLVVPPSASALLILSSHSTFCRRKTSRAQSSKCCSASVSKLFILAAIISRNVWYIITKIIGTWKFVLIVIIITTILKILMLIMVGFEGVEEPVLAWRSIWPPLQLTPDNRFQCSVL